MEETVKGLQLYWNGDNMGLTSRKAVKQHSKIKDSGSTQIIAR